MNQLLGKAGGSNWQRIDCRPGRNTCHDSFANDRNEDYQKKTQQCTCRCSKKTLHIIPEPGHKKTFSNEVHYVYGTSWGVVRGLLSLVGLTGFAATSVHLAAIWGTAITIEPKLDIAPPVTQWKSKDIAVDIFHHAVYAIVAGIVFDAID